MAYRILSFDGGPTCYYMPRLLLTLEQRAPGTLASADLFAGTSAGSALALYFARQRALGTASLDAIQGAIAFMDALTQAFQPDLAAWRRLVLGRQAMFESAPLAQVYGEYIGEDTTLDDLGAPVVLVSSRMDAPWRPDILCSLDRGATAGRSALTAAMRSSAFPVLLPIVDQHTDGAMFQNNPSVAALSCVLEARNQLGVTLDDVTVLSLGLDGGTSDLSNRRLPGGLHAENYADIAVPTIPPQLLEGAPPEVHQALQQWGTVAEAPSRLRDALAPIGKVLATSPFNQAAIERLAEGLHTGTAGELSWGWGQWLIALVNPVYLLQTFLNSQGMGCADLLGRMLQGRTMRLAPSGLLSPNDAFLLIVTGLGDLASLDAQCLKAIWSFGPTSDYLNFQPTIRQTQRWLSQVGWVTAAG